MTLNGYVGLFFAGKYVIFFVFHIKENILRRARDSYIIILINHKLILDNENFVIDITYIIIYLYVKNKNPILRHINFTTFFFVVLKKI